MNKSLKFVKSDDSNHLYGYCDADWGMSDDRRSITGYCFQTNCESAFVCWNSRKQPTVALSTCEAEYMALSAAVQEALFLKQLSFDLTGHDLYDIIIHVDNQGAIALAKNPVHHQRSKHIDIRYHFVRQFVQDGTISLQYVESEKNLADMLTKPVSGGKLRKLTQ